MEEKNKLDLPETVEEIVIDFGEICRFCLVETKSSVTIRDKCLNKDAIDLNHETIFDFVSKLSSVKMEGNENFPSLVCENCYELIKVCYNFSQVCLQSDQSLRDCYEKTLEEAKAKLNIKTEPMEIDVLNVNPVNELNEIPIQVDILIDDHATVSNVLDLVKEEGKIKSKKTRWKSTSKRKSKDSISILKADNIKQKYQRMNSLSERLKDAKSKLEEDILRSNDMMLGLPRIDELTKVMAGDKSSYPCPQCSLNFANPEALKYHYKATHGTNKNAKSITRFQCKKCTKCFSQQERLVRHYKNIHKISESDLTEDDRNYKVKKSVHSKKRKFYCLHCVPYKLFKTRELLLEHLEGNHQINEKLPSARGAVRFYACARCDSDSTSKLNLFSSRFSLNRHLRTVHKLKPDEITWKDIKCLSKNESDPNESSNLKLFKVFVCTDCSPPVSFMSVTACIQHKIETHDKQLENIPLKELSAVYVDSLDIFKHKKDISSVCNFKVLCKNCNPVVEFTSASAFVNHMYSLHEKYLDNWEIESKCPDLIDDSKKEDQLWKCSECPAFYFRKPSLYYHMKEKHNKCLSLGAMKCPESDCSESFFTNRQLIQHGISVHQKYFAHFHKIFKKKILQVSSEKDNRIKNFECDICQKKYVCKNSFKRHILKTHMGRVETESVVCPYCGKTLSNKLNLKSHIEFVHEALFVCCPICKKNINFRTIGKHYKTHQTNHALVDFKNQFLCNLCGKILKSKRGFEDHQKLHANIRDQLCDICGSKFTTKKFLLLHKKIHEGIQRKVFECHQCDKVFSGRHTLNRHLLTHSGEKNFICEICSKCFYTLQELNRHVRYHKKEYRFDCQLCDMRFMDKSRFRQHMMRHRNIRPHKCQFCDKMFIVRRKMNLHMAAKHNVEVQNTKAIWKDPKTYIPLDDLL